MPVISGDKRFQLSNVNVIIVYITVHYNAIVMVGLPRKCFYISEKS